MAVKKVAPQATSVERVQKSFLNLKATAKTLNEASDKLNDSAAKFNAAMKRLGLGVSGWVQFDGGRNEEAGYSWSQEVGYTKISGKWGLAIRTESNDWSNPDTEVECWVFADAPRLMRIKAVPHLPDLLDQLASDAMNTTREVYEQTDNIDTLTQAILNVPEEAK